MSLVRRSRETLPFVPIAEIGGRTGRFAALVPGDQAPVYPVDLPSGLRAATRERIARRQIAERIGLPEDGLDIRPVGAGAGWMHVLVCDAAQSRAWRESAEATDCAAILPDFLALPMLAEGWVIRPEGPRMIARLGREDGFSADLPLALAQLRAAAAAGTAPRAALLLGDDPPEPLTALLEELEISVHHKAATLKEAGLAAPVPPDPGAMPVNLAQPADAAVQQLRSRIARWSVPVLLAALAFAVWCASMALQLDRQSGRLAQTRAATERLLRASFIPNGPILDVRAQVSRRLADIGPAADDTAQDGPWQVLRRAAPHFAAEGVDLRAVSYRSASGLEATVTSPDFARIDALSARLQEAGLAVAVLDSRTEDGVVRARLRLGGA